MRYNVTILAAYVAIMLVVAVICSMFPPPCRAHADVFLHNPKDRPVLETVHQVWEARHTGVCRFRFDGVYYVVENMPKEYIDYSSWYVRMP